MNEVLNPGHVDRLVVRAELGGRSVVRKRFSDDTGARVHREMSAIWCSGFGRKRHPPGLPEPLGYDATTRTLDMSFADGPPLGTRGDVGDLAGRIDDVALLLADLHACGVWVARNRSPHKLLRSVARKLGSDSGDLLRLLAARAPAGESPCTSHGDFSPRNVLVTAAGPVLIDFDRLQMAGAGRDVQYLAAWCWVTGMMNGSAGRVDGWDLGERFETAYLAARPEAADDLRTGREFHRGCALVRISTGWSIMADRPDVAALVLDEAGAVLRGRRR